MCSRGTTKKIHSNQTQSMLVVAQVILSLQNVSIKTTNILPRSLI